MADSAGSALIIAAAVVFLVFHLPYLPRSLEDLDSINFALGVRHFDVAQHQPHPPGYPVYIAFAKIVHVIVSDEARALALVSVIAGALGVLATGALFRRLDSDTSGRGWAVAAAVVTMTSPLYWFTAARPLSDMTGLAAALAVQAATLAAGTARQVAAAAFVAGLAAGVRSQVVWLTVPLLIMRALLDGRWVFKGRRRAPVSAHAADRAGAVARSTQRPAPSSPAPSPQPPAPSPQPPAPSPQHPAPIREALGLALAFAAGVLLWFIPLVVLTGGPAAYWRALFNQGAEDLGNISMLWTTHNVRAVSDALYSAFVAPWAIWPIAAVILVLAIGGAASLARRHRTALTILGVAYGPYLVFDLLFQETFTGRYALPLVVPLSYLATAALRRLPRQSGAVAAVAIAMFDAHVAGTSVAAFSREKAPAFRLLDDMRSAAVGADQPPVLAMDRRNRFDFRRPMVWAAGATPGIEQQLPAPPQHEWLEAVKYWNDGGRAPVWFVVDPMRAAIDLVQHGDPRHYRWLLPYPDLVSGARPNEMDWYRVDRPEWYVGEGWSLTPEAAGVAEADGVGLAHAPAHAWIRRTALGGGLMIGGRNFDPAVRPRLAVEVGDRTVVDDTLTAGAFLRFVRLPPDLADRSQPGDYVPVVVEGTMGARVGLEQFDASAVRPLVGFGDGWHEQELNPRTGARWRWLSERGELQVRAPGAGLSLHIEGESPRKYFGRGSHFVIRSSGRVALDRVLNDDFAFDVPLAAGETVVLETDQIYVPAERSRRTQDRRHLGLRIFKCEIRRLS